MKLHPLKTLLPGVALLAFAACSSSPKKPESTWVQAEPDQSLQNRYVELETQGACVWPKADDPKATKGSRARLTPWIRGITPNEGMSLGGIQITITGEGFKPGAYVQIGQTPCSEAQVSPDGQSVSCYTQTHPPGIAEVLVINPGRQCALLPQGYRYLANVEIEPKARVVAVTNQLTFQARNGKAPYNFKIMSGAGTIDESSGAFTAPSEPGVVVIRVTDATQTVADAVVSVNPALQIIPTEGTGNSGFKFDVVGGAPPVTYSFVENPNSTHGTLVMVQDSMMNQAQIEIDLTRIPPLTLYPQARNIVAGSAIAFIASGGQPPYQFSVEGAGKINSETGLYVSTDAAGVDTVKVTDSKGTIATSTVTIEAQNFGMQKIALGYGHTCAIANTGLKCWGDNRYGQLGSGNLSEYKIPSGVVGLERDVVSVVAGQSHTCALTLIGTVRCWGDNRYGQIGDESNNNSAAPQDVFGMKSGAQQIAAGQYHTCAILRGRPYCWGSNRRGQLGDGTTNSSTIPVAVKGYKEGGVVALALGAAHSCALSRDGSVKCWGYNYTGQLGDGTIADSLEAKPVFGLDSGVAGIFAGGFHTCALINSGELKCWGNNGMGQLGLDQARTELKPVPIATLGGSIKAVSTGYYHTCVWNGSETQCFGYNRDGQLGDASAGVKRSKPLAVHGLKGNVFGLSAGVNHSCAMVQLQGNQGVQCWGSNEYGQFGNKSVVGSAIPTEPTQL